MKIDDIINNKKEKTNIKKIVLIITVLIILTFIVFAIIKLFNKNKITAQAEGKPIVGENVDIESIENKTREIIDSINFLNQVFSSNDFDESTKYNNDNGLTCVKYTGEMPDIYINVARTIYESPFSSKSYFDIKTNGEQEDLYVCKPACAITNIQLDNVKIIKENSDILKTVGINGKAYSFKKTDAIWKFSEPIVLCEE